MWINQFLCEYPCVKNSALATAAMYVHVSLRLLHHYRSTYVQTASAIAILVCISLVIIGYVFYALLVEYSSINSRCG